MYSTLNVGAIVTLKREWHGQRVGKLVSIYGMVAAAGNKRTKYTVEFKHSRTKTKTVRIALELEDIAGW